MLHDFLTRTVLDCSLWRVGSRRFSMNIDRRSVAAMCRCRGRPAALQPGSALARGGTMQNGDTGAGDRSRVTMYTTVTRRGAVENETRAERFVGSVGVCLVLLNEMFS